MRGSDSTSYPVRNMNIFFLDTNPIAAAQYHCDKHLGKMVLESAQMLCTAINEKDGFQIAPYKSTHINHPCSVWVRERADNAWWLYNLMLALDTERMWRSGKTKPHLSACQVHEFITRNGFHALFGSPCGTISPPAQAMPENFRNDDPVQAYRDYYREDKRHLHVWTKRNAPEWL